ncbi:hypothetical protein C9374_012872 [Naegleria lovaniensis]|uniref:non-specific serine/threonine protein kinase n=1 Tax=Naegleria lovaniensis TaxID=51637 RepID=A0AA88G708_NAELO|nr:uncharacterized protein C9374_012872 [Naegleria lovaniensis]KAG2373140.1 hypothetical protein C9374_012872 [Naegleria lovaniensis]
MQFSWFHKITRCLSSSEDGHQDDHININHQIQITNASTHCAHTSNKDHSDASTNNDIVEIAQEPTSHPQQTPTVRKNITFHDAFNQFGYVHYSQVLEKIDNEKESSYVFKVCDSKKYGKDIALRLVYLGNDNSVGEALKEATVFVSLSKKAPHVVQVHDAYAVDNMNVVCMEMELMQGNATEVLIEKKVSLTERMIIQVAMQICEAVKYLEEKKTIARNRILHTNDIMIKELNLANESIHIALSIYSMLHRCHRNSLFMPPELLDTKNSTEPKDSSSIVFSLGVVLYQLMTFNTSTSIPTLCTEEVDMYEFLSKKMHGLNFSKQFIELVSTMVRLRPEQRISIAKLEKELKFLQHQSETIGAYNKHLLAEHLMLNERYKVTTLLRYYEFKCSAIDIESNDEVVLCFSKLLDPFCHYELQTTLLSINHENIISIKDTFVWMDGQVLVTVTSMYQQDLFSTLIRKKIQVPERLAISILHQIVSALTFMLKFHNILYENISPHQVVVLYWDEATKSSIKVALQPYTLITKPFLKHQRKMVMSLGHIMYQLLGQNFPTGAYWHEEHTDLIERLYCGEHFAKVILSMLKPNTNERISLEDLHVGLEIMNDFMESTSAIQETTTSNKEQDVMEPVSTISINLQQNEENVSTGTKGTAPTKTSAIVQNENDDDVILNFMKESYECICNFHPHYRNVYRAVNKTTKHESLLKLFKIDCAQDMDNLLNMASISKISHPNIIHVEKIFAPGVTSSVCIEMELLPGSLHSEFIEKQVALTDTMIRQTIAQCCEALIFLKKTYNLSHGNLKPQNILIRRCDVNASSIQVVLTDIGLRQAEVNHRYQAPEITKTSPSSLEADMFSLGASLALTLLPNAVWSDLSQEMDLTDFMVKNSSTRFCRSTIELITSMLKLDPSQRISPFQLLERLGPNTQDGTMKKIFHHSKQHEIPVVVRIYCDGDERSIEISSDTSFHDLANQFFIAFNITNLKFSDFRIQYHDHTVEEDVSILSDEGVRLFLEQFSEKGVKFLQVQVLKNTTMQQLIEVYVLLNKEQKLVNVSSEISYVQLVDKTFIAFDIVKLHHSSFRLQYFDTTVQEDVSILSDEGVQLFLAHCLQGNENASLKISLLNNSHTTNELALMAVCVSCNGETKTLFISSDITYETLLNELFQKFSNYMLTLSPSSCKVQYYDQTLEEEVSITSTEGVKFFFEQYFDNSVEDKYKSLRVDILPATIHPYENSKQGLIDNEVKHVITKEQEEPHQNDSRLAPNSFLVENKECVENDSRIANTSFHVPNSNFQAMNEASMSNNDISETAQEEKKFEQVLNENYGSLQFIATGGFGQVYKGINKKNGRQVAVKVMKTSDWEDANKVIKEFQRMAQLEHENIVKTFKSYFAGGMKSIVIEMELMIGSLYELIISKKVVLNEKMVLKILKESCQALEWIQSRHNIVHRDIKPHNILIRRLDLQKEEIEIGLCDFGMARSIESVNNTTLGGTNLYFSPEVMDEWNGGSNHEEVFSFSSDVFALGVSIYQLMTFDMSTTWSTLSTQSTYENIQKTIHSNLKSNSFTDFIVELLIEMLKSKPTDRITTSQILNRIALYQQYQTEQIEDTCAVSSRKPLPNNNQQTSVLDPKKSLSNRKDEISSSTKQQETTPSSTPKEATSRENAFSQWMLGTMHRTGNGMKQDKAAAHTWLERAANNGFLEAQYDLAQMIENNEVHVEGNAREKIFKWYDKAATAGHAKAQCALGKRYYLGWDGVQDHVKARELFLLSAQQGYAEANYQLGMMYIFNADWKGAIPWLEKAAEQSHLEAMDYLGRAYYNILDFDKALMWYKKSADNGCVNSQYHVGALYLYLRQPSKGLEYLEMAAENGHMEAKTNIAIYFKNAHEYGKAIKWYERVANEGSSLFQLELGSIYENGSCGQLSDESKALDWYMKCSSNNDQYGKLACYRIGEIYRCGKGSVNKNIAKAIEFYEKASSTFEGLLRLGLIYQLGEEVQQDVNKALNYFERAAKAGSNVAQYHLGKIYLEGKIVTKNISKALNWLHMAANDQTVNFGTPPSNHHAQFMLGLIYETGIFVTRDLDIATAWYEKAMKGGNRVARFHLHLLYSYNQQYKNAENIENNYGGYGDLNNLSPSESDIFHCLKDQSTEKTYFTYSKSMEWYEQLSQNGDGFAQNNLGYIYWKIENNMQKALEYFDKSANNGNGDAQLQIGCFYNIGLGVEVDYDKAAEYFEKSANQGNEYALFLLACLYKNNDREKAAEYCERSAKKGCKNAISMLATLKAAQQ